MFNPGSDLLSAADAADAPLPEPAEDPRESRKLRKLLKKQMRKQLKEAGASADAEAPRKKPKFESAALSDALASEAGELDPLFNKDNVAPTSSYIALCMQLAVLEEQKQVLMPFVAPRVVELMARRMKKFRAQSLGPPRRKRLTAYLVFFREAKKEQPLLSMKEAGAKWKGLSEAEKLEFARRAEQENVAG